MIRACSNEGDLVLDPFCGSGTTSTVARAWNRRSITVEFGESNADSAWNRIHEIGMIRKGASSGGSSAIGKSRKSSRSRKTADPTPESTSEATQK